MIGGDKGTRQEEDDANCSLIVVRSRGSGSGRRDADYARYTRGLMSCCAVVASVVTLTGLELELGVLRLPTRIPGPRLQPFSPLLLSLLRRKRCRVR